MATPRHAPRGIALVALVAAAGCTALSYTGGARPVAPAQLDAGWLRSAPTPIVRQRYEADCGLAALAMIAGAWGHRWVVDELARHAPPTPRGIKLGVLRDLARARGLEAYAISGTPDDLQRELAKGRPVLVGLTLPFERNRARAHFEVVVAVDPRTGSAVTVDPATGTYRQRSREVLETEWRPGGYPTLVVVGDRAVARADAAPRLLVPARPTGTPHARGP